MASPISDLPRSPSASRSHPWPPPTAARAPLSSPSAAHASSNGAPPPWLPAGASFPISMAASPSPWPQEPRPPPTPDPHSPNSGAHNQKTTPSSSSSLSSSSPCACHLPSKLHPHPQPAQLPMVGSSLVAISFPARQPRSRRRPAASSRASSSWRLQLQPPAAAHFADPPSTSDARPTTALTSLRPGTLSQPCHSTPTALLSIRSPAAQSFPCSSSSGHPLFLLRSSPDLLLLPPSQTTDDNLDLQLRRHARSPIFNTRQVHDKISEPSSIYCSFLLRTPGVRLNVSTNSPPMIGRDPPSVNPYPLQPFKFEFSIFIRYSWTRTLIK